MIIHQVPTVSPTLAELMQIESAMRNKVVLDRQDCVDVLDALISGLSEFIDLWSMRNG